ncbi:hypothetical protein UWK_00535 [Desulfocapsa sulfexigens DSM 10523]|uniref:Lipoprotein n=1 Tax=Desulfocapsa sulfexigens (strain DSM 10523 / SB164P1) TaxID=1167006 RepID=M1PKV9_DESSD|nr:hypothetical protein [Desulfocapsa sulfexigens]AGF77116.1 hypothetical protein UWK_00535 [Desulfocapsa sulfexigens DSM 10523]
MMHSITKISAISFIIVCLIFFVSGCQKGNVDRPENVQPFVPLRVEFSGLTKDISVERELEKLLFCRNCLFLRAATTPSLYTLKIEYNRIIDLKSLGFFLLSAALAPIKADFHYSLRVQVVKDDLVLKEYLYATQNQEYTDSAFESMFNPFHDANGRSEEIFTTLAKSFLHDILADKPLPQISPQDEKHSLKY